MNIKLRKNWEMKKFRFLNTNMKKGLKLYDLNIFIILFNKLYNH